MVDTLKDRIFANDRVQYSRLTVANFPFLQDPGVLNVIYRESFDQPCPTITVDLKGNLDWIKRGYIATLDLGYDGLSRRVFTGTVQTRERPESSVGRISCAGDLWKVIRDIQVDERVVSGLTVEAAITTLLNDLNVNSFSFDQSLPYVLDSPVTLSRSTGLAMLTRLMEVDGMRVRELGSGQVVIGRYEGLPSVTAFRKYTTTDIPTMRILEGTLREDPTMFRSQIEVLGATLADGTTITGAASVLDTTLVQPPLAAGAKIAEQVPIPLIWDEDKANEAAVRIEGERGRIPQAFRMVIPMDPQLELGHTLEIIAPEYNILGNWLIWGIEHHTQDDVTFLDMRGGSESGGVVLVNPVAQFTREAEIEVFGTKVLVLVTLDASLSSQPDNEDETLTYAWSVLAPNTDSDTDPDMSTQTDALIDFTIDPDDVTGDTLEVKLIVTNEAGRTAAATHDIEITGGITTISPALFAAMENRFSASPDGGQNWNDESTNATGVRKVAAAPPASLTNGIGVFGRSDGKIYRTDDFCATDLDLVLEASAEITELIWDWRNPNLVWALTTDCNLYRSANLGVTWELFWNFRDELGLPTAIGRHIGLPGAGGSSVWVYGGTGVVDDGRPLIAIAGGGGPGSIFGGELGADLGAGNTNLAIVDAVDAGVGGLLIIMENYDASDSGVRPMYVWPTSPSNPATWKRATGLDAAFSTDGVYVLPGSSPGRFHAAFADRDVYHSVDGIAWTKTADVMPVDVTPNDALLMSEEQQGFNTANVYLIAAQEATTKTRGIYKSHDDMLSVGLHRPVSGFTAWPGSSECKDIAIGTPAQAAGGADRLVIVQSELGGSPSSYADKTAHLINGVWTLVRDIAPASHGLIEGLWRLGENLYRIEIAGGSNNSSYYRYHVGQLQRSTDNGATWSDVGPTPIPTGVYGTADYGVYDVAIAPPDENGVAVLYLTTGSTFSNGTQPNDNMGSIATSSIADPTVITATADHGLTTGDEVSIQGHISDDPDLDNEESPNPSTWVVTVLNATQFTVPLEITNGGTGGTFVKGDILARIYKSIDDGLTWTQIHIDDGRFTTSHPNKYEGVAVHPTNPNIIAVMMNAGTGTYGVYHSLDKGVTWTFNKINFGHAATSGSMVFIYDNGRLHLTAGNNSQASYKTDDFAATDIINDGADQVFPGNYLPDFVGTPQGLMFHAPTLSARIVRSRDYGETWEGIVDSTDDFMVGWSMALVYDQQRDILYRVNVGTSSSGVSPRVVAIDNASQILAANVGSQVIRNLDLNLDDVFDRHIAHNGIAILP